MLNTHEINTIAKDSGLIIPEGIVLMANEKSEFADQLLWDLHLEQCETM